MKLSITALATALVVLATCSNTESAASLRGGVVAETTTEETNHNQHHRQLRQFAQNTVTRLELTVTRLVAFGSNVQDANKSSSNIDQEWLLQHASSNDCDECYYVVHRKQNKRLTWGPSAIDPLTVQGRNPGTTAVWRLQDTGSGYELLNQNHGARLYHRVSVVLDVRNPLDFEQQPATIDNRSTKHRLHGQSAYDASTTDSPRGGLHNAPKEQRWNLKRLSDGNYEVVNQETQSVMGCNEYDQIFATDRASVDTGGYYSTGQNALRVRWGIEETSCPSGTEALATCARLICPLYNKALEDGVVNEYLGYNGQRPVLQHRNDNAGQIWIIAPQDTYGSR